MPAIISPVGALKSAKTCDNLSRMSELATAMDGGSVENAGAFFNLAKCLVAGLSRVELAPTLGMFAGLSRLMALPQKSLANLAPASSLQSNPQYVPGLQKYAVDSAAKPDLDPRPMHGVLSKIHSRLARWR